MTRVNDRQFEDNGIILNFSPLPIKGGWVEKFSFEISGKPDLTQKLHNAVKNKIVPRRDIPLCAQAIFDLIKSRKYETALTSATEQAALYKRYALMFSKDPVFSITDLTVQIPEFSAELNETEVPIVGFGRTKDEARANALKNFFNYID